MERAKGLRLGGGLWVRGVNVSARIKKKRKERKQKKKQYGGCGTGALSPPLPQFHHSFCNIDVLIVREALFPIGIVQKIQSAVRKKMADVHFTTVPCEPNTVKRHIESHIFFFGEIRPCT